MSDIKNVKLSFGCPNTKDSLQETANGYNCSDCNKRVIDFTNKSKAEFEQIIKSSSSSACGIFKHSQLNRTFIKYAAASTIIGCTFVFTANGQVIDKIDTEDQSCETTVGIILGEMVSDSIPFYYPEPIGGYEKFYEALKKNLKYPDSLKVNGKTYLQLTIDSTGKIKTVEVLKGFNKLADQEAVRAIKATSFPFKPSTHDGAPIESKVVIPVSFKSE